MVRGFTLTPNTHACHLDLPAKAGARVFAVNFIRSVAQIPAFPRARPHLADESECEPAVNQIFQFLC